MFDPEVDLDVEDNDEYEDHKGKIFKSTAFDDYYEEKTGRDIFIEEPNKM